jgi:hypothetical protein
LFDDNKKIEMGGACGANQGQERCIKSLVGKSQGKTPLGRPWNRREDNIKMDLQRRETRGYGLDCCGS